MTSGANAYRRDYGRLRGSRISAVPSLGRASATTSSVEWTPNFDMRLCRWVRTVFADNCSCSRDLFPAGSLDQEEQDISLTRREGREQVIAVAALVLILDEQVQHRA